MEYYHHQVHAFDEVGTTFAFITFGAAFMIWIIMSVKNRSHRHNGSQQQGRNYEPVDTSEESEMLHQARDGEPDSDRERHRGDHKGDIVEGKGARIQNSAKSNVPEKTAKIEPVTCTFDSILLLMNYLSQFGGILIYSWFCENRPLFDHANKHYSRDIFWFITLVYAAFALTTIKSNKDTSILNRDQTEEWKGWMQFLFLIYHYFHAKEVYNSIRVFISCYVWMTGFGNFSFFYIKRDFGFVRFWQMMWRLNFLVFWLIMVHGNTFILYYINPLHTFYFLMVYAAMYIFSSCNHDKYPVRWKLMVLALVIFFVWDVPGVFQIVWGFLSSNPIIGATNGTLHEWHFRSGLDHYSAVFGMAFALNHPMASAWLKATEKLPMKTQWLMKGFVICVIGVIMSVWISQVFMLPKFEYNDHHPYLFWIPLTSYIFLRNCTLTLRSYHLSLLTKMGKITLETYLMQHHIWLTTNAKSLLVFIPNSPLCNFFFVSLLYLLISHRLFRLTVGLRAMLIPPDTNAAQILLAAMVTTLSSIYGVAKIVCTVNGGPAVVILVTAAIGVTGYYLLNIIIREGSTQSIKNAYLISTGCIGGVVIICSLVEWILAPTANANNDHIGGVAVNIGLGIMILIVFSLGVLSMDSYHGITVAGSLLGWQEYPTWEEAYSNLHHKIFPSKNSAPV